jgi:hypothetical protein
MEQAFGKQETGFKIIISFCDNLKKEEITVISKPRCNSLGSNND